MTSEEVSFDALSSNTNNPYTISYAYNLSGGLKSVTDPFGSTVDYTNDRTGRLTAVDGTPYGDNTTGDYVENIKYRAFGQIKQLNFRMPNESPLIKMEYDNRQRVNHSEIAMASQTGGFLLKADYTYAADGRVTAKNDLLDDKWDNTMKYDFAGRMIFNQFGMGLGYNDESKRVYEQNIEYDAFSLMTSREGVHWDNDIFFSESYVKGRIQNSNIDYDASGNIVGTGYNDSDTDSYNYTTFDAAGRRTVHFNSEKGPFGGTNNVVKEVKNENVYDGEGRPVIEKEGYRHFHFSQPPSTSLEAATKHYQVWSSVLGSSLTMIDKDGRKLETKVFAGGAVIAKQTRYTDTQQNEIDQIQWTTADSVTGTRAIMTYSSTSGVSGSTEQYEPLGQKIDAVDMSGEEPAQPAPEQIGSASDPEWQCNKNLTGFWGGFSGMPFHCQKKALMEAGDKLPWEDEVSVKYIVTYADSPLPKFSLPNSASDNLMQYATRATAKKTGDDDDEDDDGDLPTLATVDVYDDSIPGFVDASVDGYETFRVPIPEKFEEKIKERLGKGDCNAFIAKLISKAQEIEKMRLSSLHSKADTSWYKILEGQDGYSLVKAAFEQNVISFEDSPNAGGQGVGGHASGTLIKKNAKIVIGYYHGIIPNTKKQIENTHKIVVEKYIMRAIHELIHTAGNHGLRDKLLAAAVFDLGYSDEKIDFTINDERDTNAILNYSDQWNEVLEKHCGKGVK